MIQVGDAVDAAIGVHDPVARADAHARGAHVMRGIREDGLVLRGLEPTDAGVLEFLSQQFLHAEHALA